MRVTQDAFFDMINFVGSKRAESGGFLFGYDYDHVLRRFVPDKKATTTSASYAIDADGMNPIIQKLWKKEQLQTKGIIHSHPPGSTKLSGADIRYFNDLRTYVKRKYWFAPLVQTIPDGGLKVFPFVFIEGSDQPYPTKLEVVSNDYNETINESSKIKKESKLEPKAKQDLIIVLNQSYFPQASAKSKTTEISLVVLATMAVIAMVYFGTLYGLPTFISLIHKIFGI